MTLARVKRMEADPREAVRCSDSQQSEAVKDKASIGSCGGLIKGSAV
jgi:hypothetical protein